MKQSPKKRILTFVALFGGGLCLLTCLAGLALITVGPRIYTSMLTQSSLQVGEVAPDFELTTTSGDTVRLSDFRGQPVLLTIGATWCPDCRREAQLLQQLHEKHPDLAILMIDSKENRQTVQAFADQYGLTYPIALDVDGKVNQQYRVFAIPTELLLDENGIIRARIIEQVTAESLPRMLQVIGIDP